VEVEVGSVEPLESRLGIRLRLFGEEHADVAASYNNLGNLLSDLGEYEQAREYYEKSLGIRLRLFGEEHADVALSRDLLGDVLLQLELFDEARAQYEQAAAHGNGWSMWTLAQFDVEDVDSVDGAEQVLAWVRGAAEFGVEAAAGVLEDVDGMGPMEAVARIRDLLNQDEGQ
jgi:tetratricopeptide (TPR) repeat protein